MYEQDAKVNDRVSGVLDWMLNIDCRAEVWIGGAGVKRFLGEAKLLVRPPSSWHVVTSLAPHHHQRFAPRNMEFSFCVLLYETSVTLQSIGWEQWWKICKTTVHWLGMAVNGMREDVRACPMFCNRHKRERFPTVFFLPLSGPLEDRWEKNWPQVGEVYSRLLWCLCNYILVCIDLQKFHLRPPVVVSYFVVCCFLHDLCSSWLFVVLPAVNHAHHGVLLLCLRGHFSVIVYRLHNFLGLQAFLATSLHLKGDDKGTNKLSFSDWFWFSEILLFTMLSCTRIVYFMCVRGSERNSTFGTTGFNTATEGDSFSFFFSFLKHIVLLKMSAIIARSKHPVMQVFPN